MRIHVLVNRPGQLEAALRCEAVSEIYVEADALERKADGIAPDVIARCHAAGKKCIVALPYIFRDVTYINPDAFDGILLRSLDELACYRGNREHFLISDYGLYAMNDVAAAFLEEQGVQRITAPAELNEQELSDLDLTGKELLVYGYLPMMVSAQCIRKNTGKCDRKPGILYITDRKQNRLPVENKCAYCYNLIYNPVPLSLFGIREKVKRLRPESVRINFTIEDEAEAERILQERRDPQSFTRGHFTRGVE